jgi:hypothetical protein
LALLQLAERSREAGLYLKYDDDEIKLG